MMSLSVLLLIMVSCFAPQTSVVPMKMEMWGSLNGHLKRRIKQAMLLRGSTSFNSMEDYDHFLGVTLRNFAAARRISFKSGRGKLTTVGTVGSFA